MARFRRTTQHKQKFARIMREYPTHAERRLWESLRATEWGNEVLRQQRILGWIADLHFARQGLVIEIDGPYHETRLLTDLHRDQIMESRGMRVLRIPSEMVAHNEPDILAQIHLALKLETMPELPLGAKLWQHFRDRARRDLTSIHRLNQRMYIARHLWQGPALHLQWLSEAGFRTSAELEFTLPEHSELWLTGWDFIRISHELRNDSPDWLFLYKGEVIASFVINTDGDVEEITVVRSPHKALSAEVLRIFPLLGKWIPGEVDGYKARVRYKLPVKFKLEGRVKKKKEKNKKEE